MKTLSCGMLCLALLGGCNYSDGDRTGYLQKLSRKGWFCKTYEGELAMTTVPGVAPTVSLDARSRIGSGLLHESYIFADPDNSYPHESWIRLSADSLIDHKVWVSHSRR